MELKRLAHLDWNYITQFVVIIVASSFIGNLFSILTGKKSALKENEVRGKQKILEAVSSSIKASLYALIWSPVWIALFIVVPLYWHSIH